MRYKFEGNVGKLPGFCLEFQAAYTAEKWDKQYRQRVGTDMEKLEYEVGDIVRLKKQHPCGSSEWEILRVGADFRLKCTGCGHQIMIARKLVEKNTKEIRKKA